MRQSLVENILYMVIIERIIDNFALPAVLDKLGLLQHPQLVRYGRLGHAQQGGDIANAHFCFKKRADNADPRAVPKNLEEISQIHQFFLTGHMLADIVDDILMDYRAVTSIIVRKI